MLEKRGFIWALLLIFTVICTSIVLALTPPLDPFVKDCYMNATCSGNFSEFGRVSDDGHYTGDMSSSYPYRLCCKNARNLGEGEISFKYAAWQPPYANGTEMVSVNSTITNFTSKVRLGFPDPCYLVPTGTCNNTNSEVCIFRVSNSSIDPAKWRYVADSAHVADCNNNSVPAGQNNLFPNELCCKLQEICTDGIDNDGDTYIDCADEDCKHYALNGGQNPEFCTGSNMTSSVCIQFIRNPEPPYNNQTIKNPLCMGQKPGDPITNPNSLSYHCSYGKDDSNPGDVGLCCPEGTYATKNPQGDWFCQNREKCGLNSYLPCFYDFDTAKEQWRASVYNGTLTSKWCQSKFPYYWTFDQIPYPTRSAGCCLMVEAGVVGYFNSPGNAKIYGYKQVCGDGILDTGEQCDGSVANTECSNICAPGFVRTGNVTCGTNCQLNYSGCACQPGSIGGGTLW